MIYLVTSGGSILAAACDFTANVLGNESDAIKYILRSTF